LLQAFRAAGANDEAAAKILAEMFQHEGLKMRIEGLKIYTRVVTASAAAVDAGDEEYQKRMRMLEKIRKDAASMPQ